jgi:L-cysteine S-thiosulfotransferase
MGQLVTSIVYPDHIILPKYRADYTDRDGNSEMPDVTKEMTVEQMIDLVTYIQTTYQVREPPSAYDMSYPGF